MNTSPDTWHSVAFNTNPVPLRASDQHIPIDNQANRVRVGASTEKEILFTQGDNVDLYFAAVPDQTTSSLALSPVKVRFDTNVNFRTIAC
jgi:hypothetical protein